MNEKLLTHLGNPISTQILLEFEKKDMSVKELRNVLPHIPTTTLYRYVKKFSEDNILQLAEEKPTRGTVEKIYSLAMSLKLNSIERQNQNDTQQYFNMFIAFNLGLIAEFSDYAKKINADVKKDGTGFSIAPIYATPEELELYSEAITEILKPAMIKQHAEQKLHNFAIIVTPPTEGE